MKLFSTIKDNPLLSFLIALLVLAFGAFVGVLFFECAEKYISKLLGLSDKNEALKFLGISMGGILIALQALMSYRRAKAMEETAESQAMATEEQAKANQHTEEGQRQERLRNAIEHLGHDKDSVRLGGAYELFHLAKDTKDLRQTVLDILCAHIRQTTGDDEYREKHKSKPSEEIQSLLTLLFVQKHEAFKGCHINLQESWLNGADVRGAHLEKAILTKSHLQGTILYKAHLQNANFRDAYLQGANLEIAHLQAAEFIQTRLQAAQLYRAHLQGAEFFGAHLQGARLVHASLQGARFGYAYLQEADLSFANLQGASDMLPPDAFADRIRQSIDKETELRGVVFAGGLSQEDVDSLVKDLPDKEAKELREKLESHIGAPKSNELPTGHNGPITGSYTVEEAEEWIAEYEQAMSEVPEDDS